MKKLIVIAGPTAVGKTNLAIQLAKYYQTHIFSADSRQVYKELNIGVAKPTLAELTEIPHHFINHVSIHDAYTVGDFEKECHAALLSFFETHDTAILVGGTGLYIKALLEGIDVFPEISEATVLKWNDLYAQHGLSYLQEVLLQMDADYGTKVDLQNPVRLLRALTVCDETGQPYSTFLNGGKKQLPWEVVKIQLEMDRVTLNARIDSRVDEMVEAGLVQEVAALQEFRMLKALQTVGYREFNDYFDKKISLETAISLVKTHSRQYAKRQVTWFNNQGHWYKMYPNSLDMVLNMVDKKI